MDPFQSTTFKLKGRTHLPSRGNQSLAQMSRRWSVVLLNPSHYQTSQEETQTEILIVNGSKSNTAARLKRITRP